MHYRALALSLLLISLFAGAAQAEISVASWNIRNLGWGEQKDEAAVTAVLSRFDLIAVQEVMEPEAIGRLEQRLESATNEAWGSLASDTIGRGSYKEAYAFLWREKEVSFEGGAAVYLDPGDVFAREPFSAVFADRDDGQQFVYASVHILYGDSKVDRTPEIRALADYWQWLEESFDAPVVLAGDFNMAPDESAWRALGRDARPLITRGATTLSSRDNKFANLYDNIWVRPGQLNITGVEIADFPSWLNISHTQARASVSDHAPVYMLIGNAQLSAATRSNSSGRRQSAGCVDLNTANADQLESVVHIGEARARAVIAGRPWQSLSELRRIRGLGAARVGDIKAQGQICPLP
ncbi:Endonuclease/exonuclease/phosphatase [Salinisphaera shabanensis T35B1]|uniref:endonuclease/exonuclease/phosphatase family protein n=1 Tax=Salinisphaera shabanensis TaxID=180542 RepID=UPI003341DC3F